MPELSSGPEQDPIEILPVVVLSQTFPARPSSIPDIRDFVRRCLAESPLTEEGNREVGATVFRALLDAAGPTGSIQVSFRIYPDHVEVDVLHSDHRLTNEPVPQPRPAPASSPANAGQAPYAGSQTNLDGDGERAASFAQWMSSSLRREGLTQEAAARQLGVSVKTVGRWVGGETEPRMRDLRRIQELFGELPFP
ncbi:MAG TPA: helix-turn-helix transcriptional regulator [Streptosporangiaceae bacterium]|nr:helix-turn-helix transcriptional regulator [Streptosporangiaceae bacterium]